MSGKPRQVSEKSNISAMSGIATGKKTSPFVYPNGRKYLRERSRLP